MSTDTPRSRARRIAEQNLTRPGNREALARALRDEQLPDADPTPAEPAGRLYSRGNPVRNVRLDDARWTAITERAAATGSTASDVMRDALDAYLDRRP